MATVSHPTKGTHEVPDDQAQYLARHGWTIGDAPEPPAEPPAEPDAMPEPAADRIAWIGTDPDRANAAAADESERGDKARKSVTDHIAKVLAEATPEPPAEPEEA